MTTAIVLIWITNGKRNKGANLRKRAVPVVHRSTSGYHISVSLPRAI